MFSVPASFWRLAEAAAIAEVGFCLLATSLLIMLRRRRGPERLSRQLLAGSLGGMQPRRLRRRGEPLGKRAARVPLSP